MEQQNTSKNKSIALVLVIAAILALTGIMWMLMGYENSDTATHSSSSQTLSVTTTDVLAAQETTKTKEASSEASTTADKSASNNTDSKAKKAASSSANKDEDKNSDEKSDKSSSSTTAKKSATSKASASGWNMDIDCAGCHVKEADLASDKKCAQGVAHESAKLTCVTCHTDEEVLTEVHADVSADDKMPKKATVETVDPETCEGCHGDLEKVAELTADSTALKDDQGTVVNPHQIPDGERHEENPAMCTDCHNNHSTNLSKDATKYCAQCHHRGRFECGTCHEIRKAGAAK